MTSFLQRVTVVPLLQRRWACMEVPWHRRVTKLGEGACSPELGCTGPHLGSRALSFLRLDSQRQNLGAEARVTRAPLSCPLYDTRWLSIPHLSPGFPPASFCEPTPFCLMAALRMLLSL